MANGNQRVAELLLRMSVDNSQLQKTKQAFKTLEKDVKAFAGDVLTGAQTTRVLNQEIAKLARQKAIQQITDEAIKAAKKTKDWEGALEQVERRLKRIGATGQEVSRVGQAVGVAANEATTGGRISPGARTFGRELRALPAVQIPGAGALSTDALAKVIFLLGSLPPVALPVIGVLVAIGAGFVALESSVAPAKKTLDAAVEANKTYYELLGEGATTEDAKKQFESLTETIESQRAELASIEGSFASAFEDAVRVHGEAGARLLFGLGQLTGADDKLTARADELRQSLADNEATAGRLSTELERGSFAANDLAAKEAALNEARTAALPKLEALSEQAERLQTEFAENEAKLLQQRTITAEREQILLDRQLEQQLTAHVERMADIDAQGQERLASIRKQGNKRLEQIDAEIARLGDQRADLNRKFMRSEIEAVEQFRKQEEKDTRAYNKQRIRLLQDLNNDLLDAEEANDVVAFIQAKRRGEQELQRLAEDASEETQERQAQFLEERRLADQKHQEDLARITDEIAQRQTARREIEIENAAQLEAERLRIRQVMEETQAAFTEQQRLAQEDRDLRAKWQKEDRQREDQARRDALNKQLLDIDAKVRKEASGIQVIGTAVDQLIQAVRNGAVSAINSIVSAGGSSTATGSSGGTGLQAFQLTGAGRTGVTAFATGGIARRPTLAMVGDRAGYHEAMIPYKPSQGLAATLAKLGLGGRSTVVNLTFNATVGDVVTTRQLQEVKYQVVGGIIEGLARASRP